MHQQVRTSTKKSGATDGPGAMADEGGLVDILQILLDEKINLRTAGGRDLDRGGEFVFAVAHERDDDGPAEAAAQLLRRNGYRARVVRVRECLVNDEPGALLRCIEEAEASEGAVHEIFVGTPEEGGIPIQLTSRAALEEGQTAS
jgi:hypothetical protein